jgi:membrane protein DedA with SNARE-associated domain
LIVPGLIGVFSVIEETMSTPALPGIFQTVEPLLNHYGYLAVALFVTVEDFGIPLPGETILIAAALFAGAGRLNVILVGVVATLAAVVGDNIGFAIGHFGGRALALRFGKYVFLTEERLDKAENFFEHHGGKIIVIARFIEGLRQANGIVAGISGMNWRRFLAFNALGAALWAGVWVSLGYLAGNHITTIYNQITRYSLYVLIALVVVVVAFIVRWLWRRRRGRQARASGAGSGAAATTGLAGPDETPEAHVTHEADKTGETTPTARKAPEPGATSEISTATEPHKTSGSAERHGVSGIAEAGDQRGTPGTGGTPEGPRTGGTPGARSANGADGTGAAPGTVGSGEGLGASGTSRAAEASRTPDDGPNG